MAKPFENLDSAFEIESAEKETRELKKQIKKADVSSHIEQDYTYVRTNLTALAEKGQEILDGIMDVADASQSPRAYEVAVAGVKNVAEVVEKLTDLHKKIADLEGSKNTPSLSGTNVSGNVFISASMSDLMEMIKKEKKLQSAAIDEIDK